MMTEPKSDVLNNFINYMNTLDSWDPKHWLCRFYEKTEAEEELKKTLKELDLKFPEETEREDDNSESDIQEK